MGKIGKIQSWLKELIYAQVKKRLMNKEQAQIRDLGIEPLLVEQGSLNMLQFWSNYHSTIGLYGVGASAANFYQFSAFSSYFWRKIKSIDLTNNSGSKRRPPSATYHTCPSLIITVKSKCMGLVRKFSFDHQAVRQLHRQECKLAFVYQNYNLYQ